MEDFEALARSLLEDQMNAPWLHNAHRSLYFERLRYETESILQWGLESHFISCMELVQHLKTQGFIVGPGGGEAGSSLLAYALGIHDVDPIRHGLIFESQFGESCNPVFQVSVCSDGYVEARQYLTSRHAHHMAWEGYGEHEILVITQRPVREMLNVIGSRIDIPVVTRNPGQVTRIQLIPSPLLGKISRTSRFLFDVLEDDSFAYEFEDFRQAPDLEDQSERDALPDWVPDASVPILECLKQLGAPKNFDEFVFAYHLATHTQGDVAETNRLTHAWIKEQNVSPWAQESVHDDGAHQILACTHGIVVYREQIAELLAYYMGTPMQMSLEWVREMAHWSIDESKAKRTEFVYQASLLGHSKTLAIRVFDYLVECASKTYCAFKNQAVDSALMANGASQVYVFFSMAGT
jgi:hypothetical protein